MKQQAFATTQCNASKVGISTLFRTLRSTLSRLLPYNQILNSNLSKFLRFTWQSSPRWSLTSAALVALLGASPVATLYLVKLAVDAVEGTLGYDTIFGFNALAVLIVLLCVATLLESVCASAERTIGLIQSIALTDRMFDILHAKSALVDLEYYETARYHDTLHRAQQEAPVRPARVMNNLRLLAQHGISLMAIGCLLIWLHWGVVLVLVATAIPGVIVRIKYARKAHFWERKVTWRERRASYLNWLLTRDMCAKEIRLFGLEAVFIDRFRQLRFQIRQARVRLASRKTVAEVAAMSGAIIVSFALLGYLAMRTVHGLMSLGDLVMFYAAVQRGQVLLRQFFNNVADLYEDDLFLSNLYEFLGLKPKLKEPFHPKSLNHRLQGGVVFDNVSFQYPGGDKRVLDHVALTIRPGEHVALVGENGAGKTTFTKLLCRLYDPTEGTITLDGVDLRDYATKDLRRHISVVFQDYGRYQLTAGENIWLGNVHLPMDERQLDAAARRAGADPVIAKLPDGYDTLLGNWFEGGQELSAGEWQKIALARAFLHDGEIIVLDEPGSALDAKAEHEIFERFHQLVKGKTAILISHRLSTVKMADRIYVLKQGRIVEAGTHDELLKAGGTYAWMFETQAQRYR